MGIASSCEFRVVLEAAPELDELLVEPPAEAGAPASVSIEPLSFRSAIKAWRVLAEPGARSAQPRARPLRPSEFDGFKPGECYVVLHTYRRDTAHVESPPASADERPPKRFANDAAEPAARARSAPAQIPTLSDLAEESALVLSPRGLAVPFSKYDDFGLEPSDFRLEAAEPAAAEPAAAAAAPERYAHALYVWNGVDSSAVARAVAIGCAFQIERRMLRGGRYRATVRELHARAAAAAGSLDAHALFAAPAWPAAPTVGAGCALSGGVPLGGNHLFELLAEERCAPAVRHAPFLKLLWAAGGAGSVGADDARAARAALAHPWAGRGGGERGGVRAQAAGVPAGAAAAGLGANPLVPALGLGLGATATAPAPLQAAAAARPARPQSAARPIAVAQPAARGGGSGSSDEASSSDDEEEDDDDAPPMAVVAVGPAVPKLGLGLGGGGGGVEMPRLGGGGLGGGKLDLSALRSAGASAPTERELKEAKLRQFDGVCSQILPNLFLGSDTVARDLPLLRAHGVTHVVNAASVACANYHEGLAAGLAYCTLPLNDAKSEDLVPFVVEALSFLAPALAAGGVGFVHCHQGVSRSASIVVAYLMAISGLPERPDQPPSFERACACVRAARGVCSPNPGFTVQLMLWDRRTRAQAAQEAQEAAVAGGRPLPPAGRARLSRLATVLRHPKRVAVRPAVRADALPPAAGASATAAAALNEAYGEEYGGGGGRLLVLAKCVDPFDSQPLSLDHLDARGVFLLQAAGNATVFVWQGRAADGGYRAHAALWAARLGANEGRALGAPRAAAVVRWAVQGGSVGEDGSGPDWRPFWEALSAPAGFEPASAPIRNQPLYDRDYGVGALRPPALSAETAAQSGGAIEAPAPSAAAAVTPRSGGFSLALKSTDELKAQAQQLGAHAAARADDDDDARPETPRGAPPSARGYGVNYAELARANGSDRGDGAEPNDGSRTPRRHAPEPEAAEEATAASARVSARLYEPRNGWEEVTMFESDDLLPDGAFALVGSVGDAVSAFLWVGADSGLADDEVERLCAEMASALDLPDGVEVVVQRDGEEDDNFDQFLVNG